MFREKIPPRQLSAWLFTGVTPVVIQLLGGSPWAWVAIIGTFSVIVTVFVWRSGWCPLKWQCPILYIYIVICLGQLLSLAAQSWPKGDATAVPLILLLVAAWSAHKGPSAAARTGTVLFWAVLILYLVTFAAGAADVHWEWLKPQWTLSESAGWTVLLALPASACLVGAGSVSRKRLFLPVLFGVIAALITAGVLSPQVAEKTETAFYEMSRSVSLLGVARRFEALISAAMTVGWFALLSLLLAICATLTHTFLPGWGGTGIWLGAGAATGVMLCGLHISPLLLSVMGAVFWVVMPLLTQGLEKRKKS